MECTKLASYATIRLDKCLNNVVDELEDIYGTKAVSKLIDQDLFFKSIAMVCNAEEILEYIDYILSCSTDFIHAQNGFYGIVVKPYVYPNPEYDGTINNSELLISNAYKRVKNDDDAYKCFDIDFIFSDYLESFDY